MDRTTAAQLAREELNKYGLNDWKIKLVVAPGNGFLGKCSYTEKAIYLHTHHIDLHDEKSVLNTIRHEIAHALTPKHNHDDVWKAKAHEIGCDNTSSCSTLTLDIGAIDAIRSGQILEVEIEEKEVMKNIKVPEIVRTANYKVTRFQDKCAVCGKVAKEKLSKEFESGGWLKRLITLECGHIRIVNADSQSRFDLITFDGDPNCKHVWNKTVCTICDAKKLYPFQIKGAQQLEKWNGRGAIFDEMGLGKTIQPLAYLKFHPELFPALFVVKTALKYQWNKEIVRVLGPKYFPQIVETGKSGIFPGLKCYIVSYDMLRRFDTSKLQQLGIKTVILDEVQQIKNPDSSRTQEVRKVCRDIPHMIALSGTPWKNRGSEFFVVLNMLDPKKFWSYQSFVNQWVDYYWDGARYKEGGIRNIAKFKEYIKDLAIRRERIEVMPELPTINRMRLHTKIEEHAAEAYEKEALEFVKSYNEAVIGGMEDDGKVQMNQIAQLQRMRHILGLAKIPQTMDFVEEFLEETDRKLVIFVHHKDVHSIIAQQCKDLNQVEVLSLTAELSASERFEMCEKFNKLPRSIMVASTLAAGEGLNLQTCCDCVMHERQWNPMNEEQAEGRFSRIGSVASSINATYVHADQPGSVDIHLNAIVEGKRVNFHKVMNNSEMPVWKESSMIKELAMRIAADFKGRKVS